MKPARLLFMVISLGALTIGRSFAGETSKTSLQRDSEDKHSIHVEPAETTRGKEGVLTDRNHDLLKGTDHGVKRNGQASPSYSPAKRTTPDALHPPAFKKTAPTATQASTMNKKVQHHEQPAKLTAGRETAAQFPGLVHGRPVATAALGGSTAFGAKYPVLSLDGAAMKGKP
jgi:hypothetical protein